jgi:hypothetical protein
MELAGRDLKVAKAMLGVNNDWTYSMTHLKSNHRERKGSIV